MTTDRRFYVWLSRAERARGYDSVWHSAGLAQHAWVTITHKNTTRAIVSIRGTMNDRVTHTMSQWRAGSRGGELDAKTVPCSSQRHKEPMGTLR